MKKIIISAFLSICSLTAVAENQIALLGVGGKSCDEFLNALKTEDGEMIKIIFQSWAQGYVTGRNRQLLSMGYKQKNLSNLEKLTDAIIFSCDKAMKQGKGSVWVSIVIDKMIEQEFEKNLLKDR